MSMKMTGFMKRIQNPAAVGMALTAALLYGAGTPFSKKLLTVMPPTRLASSLYLGAGFGMLVLFLLSRMRRGKRVEAGLSRKDAPYVIAMILLDVLAPILLMVGLMRTTAANASLLNNFEIVATACIALLFFHEAIGRRMWLAIALVTLSSILLSFEDLTAFTFSTGSLFVLGACVSWGLENNCTRMLSLKDPMQIVIIKGFGSGLVALGISMLRGERAPTLSALLPALLLGFFAYGLSILTYIMAQREIGAARTSAWYAAAPFIGVALSWILLREPITWLFAAALVIMLTGAWLAVTESHTHAHHHPVLEHEHPHRHGDLHHQHGHGDIVNEHTLDGAKPAEDPATVGHSHLHVHTEADHAHPHMPDLHHRHRH